MVMQSLNITHSQLMFGYTFGQNNIVTGRGCLNLTPVHLQCNLSITYSFYQLFVLSICHHGLSRYLYLAFREKRKVCKTQPSLLSICCHYKTVFNCSSYSLLVESIAWIISLVVDSVALSGEHKGLLMNVYQCFLFCMP